MYARLRLFVTDDGDGGDDDHDHHDHHHHDGHDDGGRPRRGRALAPSAVLGGC
jgi:hypothetical protein